ncbi:hypothetical protein AB4Z48_39305, partial [Cupriavidus sp. 2TAF22]|uniref:hypothetical protein n=1 Tax=unclassified Cupriavidus TaxID=2640874 RepID=UPI003F8EB34D
RSLMARVVVMAVLLEGGWPAGRVSIGTSVRLLSSIFASLGRYKRMECAKAGHVASNRPQTQAGLGRNFLREKKMAPESGAGRL